MWIGENLGIDRQQRDAMNSRRCDDQLIGWVTMELTRKVASLDLDLSCQREQPHLGKSDGHRQPLVNGPVQIELSSLALFGDLPA